jgi:hypothetical protein
VPPPPPTSLLLLQPEPSASVTPKKVIPKYFFISASLYLAVSL